MQTYSNVHARRASNGIKRILVVDDEPEVLGCLCYHLGDHYPVISASSGSEALQCISEEVGLAILDYRLPDMSGIEVLKEIKQAAPSVHVMIMTGYGDEDVAMKALRHGAMDYIKKPFNVSELINRIEWCLVPDRSMRSGREAASSGADGRSGICAEARPHAHYRIQNAIKYISDNFSSKITLESVAAKACMSKYHFSRSFRKATGTTYRDYLSECRIKKAKELLISRDLPVTEIAFAVGYTDMTHFARAFRKIAGLAPSQYKRDSRNQAEPSRNK